MWHVHNINNLDVEWEMPGKVALKLSCVPNICSALCGVSLIFLFFMFVFS